MRMCRISFGPDPPGRRPGGDGRPSLPESRCRRVRNRCPDSRRLRKRRRSSAGWRPSGSMRFPRRSRGQEGWPRFPRRGNERNRGSGSASPLLFTGWIGLRLPGCTSVPFVEPDRLADAGGVSPFLCPRRIGQRAPGAHPLLFLESTRPWMPGQARVVFFEANRPRHLEGIPRHFSRVKPACGYRGHAPLPFLEPNRPTADGGRPVAFSRTNRPADVGDARSPYCSRGAANSAHSPQARLAVAP